MDQNIMFIGLIEEGNSHNLFKITNELFNISGYSIIFNCMDKVFAYSNNNNVLIVFDFIAEDLINQSSTYFNFDIVVYSSINNDYQDIAINLFKHSKVCIYNSDGESMIPLLGNLENVIAINYGFNNKASLTISNYNIDENIEANLCLQRDIMPFYDEKIEPFEFVLEINLSDEKIIYPVLAAATLNLIIGNSILNRKPFKNVSIKIKAE